MDSLDARRRQLPLRALVALLVVYVFWGSTYVATRFVVRIAPPFESMGIRFLLAGIVVLGWVAARGGPGRLALAPRYWLGTIAMALALLAINNGAVSFATRHGLPSGVAALLLAMVSIWIVVIRWVGGDRPSRLTLLGTVLGCAATAFIVGADRGTAAWPVGGVVIVLTASVCWAFGLCLRPRVQLPEDTVLASAYQMVVAGVFLYVAGLADREPVELDFGRRAWIAIAYLVVAVSIIGYTCYVYLIDTVPLSLVATHVYVNPVVAVLLGWALLSETLGVEVIAAGSLVVLSSVLLVRGEQVVRDKPTASP